jgi:hypothetical protein
MGRRTTFAIEEETLASLRVEAARRGTSLAAVLREALDEKAVLVRSSHRPRVGSGRSTDGVSAAMVTAEPIGEPPN